MEALLDNEIVELTVLGDIQRMRLWAKKAHALFADGQGARLEARRSAVWIWMNYDEGMGAAVLLCPGGGVVTEFWENHGSGIFHPIRIFSRSDLAAIVAILPKIEAVTRTWHELYPPDPSGGDPKVIDLAAKRRTT